MAGDAGANGSLSANLGVVAVDLAAAGSLVLVEPHLELFAAPGATAVTGHEMAGLAVVPLKRAEAGDRLTVDPHHRRQPRVEARTTDGTVIVGLQKSGPGGS